ncbi:SgcJ/EcaC family oxidoreductase [Stigmatella sp. ncwal1]|uniref:SgcJ/EcaC family oxidoreductase n=1 Tax=Stigmatella ashevillensis TaxID=2995309 RepID=A0ABT5D5L7_9BACT|nr:SgcJ/EcaC family oxidoreductase [Stigmatella ashevillena]MDC0708861.1 SgcJ/EcaC family oxidoreductase [Stigmatella ashevillena]
MTRLVSVAPVLTWLFLFSTACAHGNPAQDERDLHQLVAVQAEAWNSGDAVAWSKDFTQDADFVNIVGSVFEGHDQIEQRHAAIFSTLFKGSQVKVTVRKIVFPQEDIAVVDTVHEVTGHGGLPPGVQNTEPGLLRTRMKYVMRKTAGKWQILAGQNTDAKPVP